MTDIDTLRAAEADALDLLIDAEWTFRRAEEFRAMTAAVRAMGDMRAAYAAAIEARVLDEHEHLCEGCYLVRGECTCSMFWAGSAYAPTRSP